MMKRFYINHLREGLLLILKNYAVPQQQAEILVDVMLEADMRGIHTHGVNVFPAYITKIKTGGFNFSANCEIIQRTSAFAVVDANNQLGMVSAKYCMNIAIKESQRSGIYTVFCRNANTFGAAFNYVKMATEKNFIGVCFSNSPSAMPAWGGNKKALGTNPFAIGIPTQNEAPIIIDMATSIVAKSKINEIRKQGGTLPNGWAFDENGQPTTDPEEAIKGMILPMAEHKGYAIAMAIDIIAGVLSGAGYLYNINRFYSADNKCMNVGHCFIAINPSMIFGEGFPQKIDAYIAELRETGENIRYPGENGNRKKQLCSNGTVELSDETAKALMALFDENNIQKALREYVG